MRKRVPREYAELFCVGELTEMEKRLYGGDPYRERVGGMHYCTKTEKAGDTLVLTVYPILGRSDRAKAEAMNIPVSRVFSTLQSKLASFYINDFNLYNNTFKVKMQSEAEERSTLGDISQILVQTNSGKMAPLSAIADVSYIIGPRQVTRFNQYLAATVTAQAKAQYSSGQLMSRIQELADTNLPKDYRISWTDMSYQESQTCWI